MLIGIALFGDFDRAMGLFCGHKKAQHVGARWA